ncbi:MAG: 50S ribosomal protein L24 [Deltaproteobacteria bacterium]|nr:MAG: 50S ribosomal protein L24 [Deltaproteobacteria bacterium]
MSHRHVRRGDQVIVTGGKYRGQTGRLLQVLVETQRVRIEGIATVKRHLKPGKDAKHQQGGIVEKLGSIHLSKVALIDPKDGKATRTGIKVLEGGKKVRFAKRSGETIGDTL